MCDEMTKFEIVERKGRGQEKCPDACLNVNDLSSVFIVKFEKVRVLECVPTLKSYRVVS